MVDRGELVSGLSEPRFSQSLGQGLAVLRCFTPARPVLGVADVADEVSMPRSTAHRYLVTLVALGYLEQDARRKYRLGLRATDLGLSVLGSMGLRERARPVLERLASETAFAVTLGVLDGPEVLVVDSLHAAVHVGESVVLFMQAGSRLPVCCTALGKVLLAFLPEREQSARIAQMTLVRGGPNAVGSKRVLRGELDGVRERGVAVEDEELAVGLRSIAAPIRDQGGEVVAAVGVCCSRADVTVGELAGSLGAQLLVAASRASSRLGYRRSDE